MSLCPSIEKQPAEKAEIIIKHVENDCVLQRLQFWCLSRYGLVNDSVRRKVWPVLSGIKPFHVKNTHELSDLLNHPQAKQIDLDVRRMGSMIPKSVSHEENQRLITETKRLALSILVEYPDLHYYQGFHDICYTCLAVLGPDEAFAVLKQLVPKHFTVFMQKTMDATSETLQLVFDLLQLTSPEIWSRFQDLNFEPFFTLSWFLTWFTHILSDDNDIHRLYDLFMASEPYMLIYLSVSVIICSTKEISSTSNDFGELHHALTHLPMKHDVEKLIQCALDIYLAIGPEKLLKKAEDRKGTIQANSKSTSALALVNHKLLVYGAVAAVTKMQVYAFIMTVCLLGVQCELPVAITGPGGSSFSLVGTWSDSDLGAFADVNLDRRTDAIVLSSYTSALYTLVAPNAKQTGGIPERKKLIDVDFVSNLRSIAVADFNGDSRTDLLLVYSKGSLYEVTIRYDVMNASSYKRQVLSEFTAQPLVCDANADMIADIYGENQNGRVISLGGHDGLQMEINFTTSQSKLSNSGGSGFVSLSSNANPSLVLRTTTGIEVFHDLASLNGQVREPVRDAYELPQQLRASSLIGKFVFGDFDMSGRIGLLVTGCDDNKCTNSYIFRHSLSPNADWEMVPVEWVPPNMEGEWSLAPTSSADFSSSDIIGPSLGDADLDGYPDLALGLQYRSNSGAKALILPAILRNLAGDGKGVRFQAYLLPGIEINPPSILKQIAFYDYNEDGILDLFLSYRTYLNVRTYLYTQKLAKEAYFLKVMLTTGGCGSPSQCPNGILPYGLPGYGFRASYETQGADGRRIRSSGVFVTSSCCGALQLPFTTFGFGDFATYIENVTVSVPAPAHQTRTHELTFIVPNAQVVVVPYPYENPSNWKAKLFLQPLYDMKVIYVAITLLVTCVILIIVVSMLQYLEVRSDRKERMQESQRFHFDAM